MSDPPRMPANPYAAPISQATSGRHPIGVWLLRGLGMLHWVVAAIWLVLGTGLILQGVGEWRELLDPKDLKQYATPDLVVASTARFAAFDLATGGVLELASGLGFLVGYGLLRRLRRARLFALVQLVVLGVAWWLAILRPERPLSWRLDDPSNPIYNDQLPVPLVFVFAAAAGILWLPRFGACFQASGSTSTDAPHVDG